MKTASENSISDVARKVITSEIEALTGLVSYCDESFDDCVRLIASSKGRLVITGIGKSAIIAGKIVATLNSTGTPALFMHAADAIHGDLGMIQPDDVVMCISKSGNTPEIKVLIPLIRRMGNTLIAMVSETNSYLATESDYVIRTTVSNEACPNNLAPTSSTTAQLVMGDALAVCLLELKGFTQDDFARLHPGGSLGKKMYLHVSDICKMNPKPQVSPDAGIDTIILEITGKLLGATAVTDETGRLLGVITDGDIRRMLQRNLSEIARLRARDIMNVNPKTIDADELAIHALRLIEKHNISQVIVTENGKYAGIVHLHDLIREGLV
ncbi:MAG TPA: KpsF/GutQ family sugar-phosphate isomerase [Bacteroidales bacterium]|nr:KpsF/GutQ family sugar-phosphate isomerase [Bacteroidales bacterium]HQL70992.1 KpsF/GutQ family sugar-phosphate isomerase [Bacteroidales bacterium]